jgi:hypothetical protein
VHPIVYFLFGLTPELSLETLKQCTPGHLRSIGHKPIKIQVSCVWIMDERCVCNMKVRHLESTHNNAPKYHLSHFIISLMEFIISILAHPQNYIEKKIFTVLGNL